MNKAAYKKIGLIHISDICEFLKFLKKIMAPNENSCEFEYSVDFRNAKNENLQA